MRAKHIRPSEGSPSEAKGTNCTFAGNAKNLVRQRNQAVFKRTHATCGLTPLEGSTFIMNISATTETKSLLIVDDDITFTEVLANALTKRGYDVTTAGNVENARNILSGFIPDYAIVDLRMPGPSGLELIPQLCEINQAIRIVVLTGYASIATAIEAIKLGAVYYLTKPTDADEIVSAFHRDNGDSVAAVTEKRIPLDRLEWEYIQKVLADCNGNISAAARILGMHRRTLQRKLQKRPSRME